MVPFFMSSHNEIFYNFYLITVFLIVIELRLVYTCDYRCTHNTRIIDNQRVDYTTAHSTVFQIHDRCGGSTRSMFNSAAAVFGAAHPRTQSHPSDHRQLTAIHMQCIVTH